jgi:imidazolonepropionase-like amidohydrolase
VWALFLVGITASTQQRPQFTPTVRDFIRVDEPVVVLQNVRVIDGTGAPARENQTVVIAQGKIAAMGDAGSTAVPNGARVLDLTGYSVMPGMVGMHNHMHYPAPGGAPSMYPVHATSFPRLYLAGGVTTIRTTGSMEVYTEFEIKKMIEHGRIAGPKMHVSGPYFEGPGSFTPQMRELSDAEDARKMAEYWLDLGVTSLKAFMHITPAQLSAMVKAAHARNIKVIGHLCSIGFRRSFSRERSRASAPTYRPPHANWQRKWKSAARRFRR